MVTLVSLVGEQVIPNLLPYKYIQPDKNILLYSKTTEKESRKLENLMNNVKKVEVEAYDFQSIYSVVKNFLNKKDKVIFNLTGGTKVMSMGMFLIAYERENEFVYFQSEGNTSVLYRYQKIGSEIKYSKEVLPELIDIDTYLKAHLFQYQIENKNNSGSAYENLIAKVIKKHGYSVISNVKPVGEGNQLEIDLVIKKNNTNNFAIAEIKIGDKYEEGPKKGIEQLALAGQREYLGIYTKRILITSRIISKQLRELALAHRIIVIDNIKIDKLGNLLKSSEETLINTINEKLS